MRKIIFLLLIAILLLPSYSFAGFYCGTQLIQLKDSSYSVLEKCGEPLSRIKVSGEAYTLREEWVYHINGYRVIITVWQNQVVEIKEERI